MKTNFLVFDLCDNDFGFSIVRAVKYAVENEFYEYAGEDCVWWKAFMIQFILADLVLQRKRNKESLYGTQEYLEARLTVYPTEKFPTYDGETPVDHDGGSVILDVHTKFITPF